MAVRQGPTTGHSLPLGISAKGFEFPHTLNALEMPQANAMPIQHTADVYIQGLKRQVVGERHGVHSKMGERSREWATRLCGKVWRHRIR